jgi:lipid A ethanolaminephosphotransferase
MNFSKINASVTYIAVACAIFIVLAYNRLFWTTLFNIVDVSTLKSVFFIFNVFIIFVGLITVLILLFGFKYLLRPFLVAIFILSSIIGYFEAKYGTVIDISMIRSITETDYKETRELITLSFALHVLIFGLLPSAVLSFVRIQFKPIVTELSSRALFLFIVVMIIGLSAVVSYKDLTLIGREHKELRLSINPGYALYSACKLAIKGTREDRFVQPVGLEAHQQKSASNRKKDLIILVIGETAREKEFSLNGYARTTDPYLSHDSVISFTRAYSCGTSTTDSLPCMFSHLDEGHYSRAKAVQYENLLDVLSHAGVDVLWRDNNSGCKGVCSRVKTENMASLSIPGLCTADECFDEILLYRLQEYINGINSSALIVLHQKGSHGPAYYKRHPDKFSLFMPECTSSAPQNCERDQIVNAYDNTIVYTDYFLHKTIKLLKNNARRFNTMMIYFSDHGESLGENGIYLHGLPYLIAPDEQKHVPFILWLSDEYAFNHGTSTQCLMDHRDQSYSHYNIFHSLLGAFDVTTDVYREKNDILKPCRAI